MKIVRLQSENVKRLKAIDITPGADPLVTVGGKNDAGKSSVLDSIAYALGGSALIPSEPIRKGESEARIEVDLGDLVVVRKFKRERVQREEPFGAHPPDSNVMHVGTIEWGETRSSLVIKNKDGATYPSPQALLDGLLGKLTFDPLAFKDMPRDAQHNTLKKLVGLDFSALDMNRQVAYERRTALNREVKELEAKLKGAPQHPDVPAEETPMQTVSEEMLAAERARQRADETRRQLDEHQTKLHELSLRRRQHADLIKKFEAELEQERQDYRNIEVVIKDAQGKAEILLKTAQEAQTAVPDMDKLRQRLTDVEALNAKVRDNKKRAGLAQQLRNIQQAVTHQAALIESFDLERERKLAAAQYPVPGLGLNDEGVTFNGVPFEQASTSEQLRVSVATGLALNPKLKVLLVRNGNALDDDSLKLVGNMAAEADAQVWLEYVTANAEGVSVMLEDGAIV
jgi:hypothetical protein